MLLNNPAQVRYQDREGSGIFGLLMLLPLLSALALVLRWLISRQATKLTLFSLAISVGYFSILPERSTVIAFVLWSAGMAFILDSKFKRRTVRYAITASLGIATILAFFIAVSARTNKVDFVSGYRYAVAATDLPDALIDPYVYLTASLPALNSLMVNPSLPALKTEWQHIAYPAARILQIILPSNSNERLSEAEDPVYIPMYFNTFTWLSVPLKDLGLFGSYIYIFLVGWFSGLTYKMAKTRAPFWVYLYGGTVAATLLSIMTNRFSSLAWWVATAFALMLFGKSVKKRNFTPGRSSSL